MSLVDDVLIIGYDMRLSELIDEEGPVTRFWNSTWIGVPLWLVSATFAVYSYIFIPSPGKAIAALAVVAGVMSVRDSKVLGKIAWVSLLVLMLIVEFRAIDKDRKDSQAAEDKHLKEERESFKSVLVNQASGFSTVLGTQQQNFEQTLQSIIDSENDDRSHFESTIRRFNRVEQGERERFAALLKRDDDLYEHEQKLAGVFDGVLTPGTDQTPENDCRVSDPAGILIFLGDEVRANVAIVDSFPSVVLGLRGNFADVTGMSLGTRAAYTPLVTLEKTPDGNIAVDLEIRQTDGKIIVRMNRDGFVVNRNGALRADVATDHHRLTVIDEFGQIALDVRYINPRALSIKGTHIDLPSHMDHFCARRSGPYILTGPLVH
jgi:hypothetical protein